MTSRVAELDTMDRLRNGAAALRPEQIDGRALLAETADRFRARAAGKGIELAVIGDSVQPPAGTPPGTLPDLGFSADRVAVDRILGNLIENALSVVPSPGGHVWLEARGSAEWITLLVSDDGPGFPPGASERIFDRFYRGDPARSGPGSGLGLAIVRELARAHGGEAQAESLAPRGARVIVHLPRNPRMAW